MRDTRPTLTLRLTLACALSLLLAGCTSGQGSDAGSSDEPSPTTSTTAAASDPPETPRRGQCYRLSLTDATRPTTEEQAVSCSARHTALTIHVGRLDLVVRGRTLAVDAAQVQEQPAKACPRELNDFVGGDAERRRLSRLQVVWFTPTLEEASEGADWFRCDLISFGRGDQLQGLPPERTLRGVLDREAGLADFGLCGTAKPGARGFQRVACGFRHSWRAVSTIAVPGGKAYPGGDEARQAGDEECAELVRSLSGLPLKFSYGLEWPTRAQWSGGQRYGFCWAPLR